jgi:copper chaperone CopZ
MASDSGFHALRWAAAAAFVVAAIVLTFSTLTSVSAQNGPGQAKTVSIPIEGMSCVACAARVKRALKGINGVQQVEVSLELREATVQFLPDKVTPQRLEAAINELGYKVGKSRVVESK